MEIATRDLVDVTGAVLRAGRGERICRGCTIDSRVVTADAIFVAFPGEHVDGNLCASAALEAGAGAVVLTREPDGELCRLADECDAAVLVNDDPEEFLLRLAAAYRAQLSCTVIGITGSIGKTSTKDLLAALLASRFRVHATRGNRNNLIGMPLAILSAPLDTQMLVLEMGMSARGEIERLSRCARPAFAIITKIGTSHIGMLGSRENIARAKAEILAGMGPDAAGRPPLLVLDADDDFTPFIADEHAAPAGVGVLRVGMGQRADVRVRDVSLDELGRPAFQIAFQDGSRLISSLPVLGAQAVHNAALAAALAHELGLGSDEIDAALRHATITSQRQELCRTRSGALLIDDSYNASPESMAAALDLMDALEASGSRIAVLGEMGELGEQSARLHGLVGAYAAAKRLDLLVCVGADGARSIADAARLMGMASERIELVADSADALARFGSVPTAGDLVLVKGSRFIGLDRFAAGVL